MLPDFSSIFNLMFINGYPMATHPESLQRKGFRVFYFPVFQNWLPFWLPSVIFPPFYLLCCNTLRYLFLKS